MILLPFIPKRLVTAVPCGIIRQAKVIITPMEPPDRIISISELHRSTDERVPWMYMAYYGSPN